MSARRRIFDRQDTTAISACQLTGLTRIYKEEADSLGAGTSRTLTAVIASQALSSLFAIHDDNGLSVQKLVSSISDNSINMAKEFTDYGVCLDDYVDDDYRL